MSAVFNPLIQTLDHLLSRVADLFGLRPFIVESPIRRWVVPSIILNDRSGESPLCAAERCVVGPRGSWVACRSAGSSGRIEGETPLCAMER